MVVVFIVNFWFYWKIYVSCYGGKVQFENWSSKVNSIMLCKL